ncbi:sugar transferase [Leuconostoc lactis]
MTNFITQTIEPWMPPGALKAKADYATIAQTFGWTRLPLYRYNDTRFDQATLMAHIQDWLAPVKANDLVVHQFPTYMSAQFEQLFVATLQARQVQCALVIHDIEPLRLNKLVPWEFDVLKQYDTLVVHSQAMQQRLQAAGIMTRYVIQPLFDYLGVSGTPARFSTQINFAGTFQKSPWLQTYRATPITLFGAKPKKWRTVDFPDNITYQGNFDPDELINQFTAGFGLIWDDDFDDKTYQTYTKYNAPHKASLYLRAGLPLVAWSESAIGQLITTQNLGFTIDHLSDLADRLALVTATDFANWQTNGAVIAEKLRQGLYTKATLTALTT